MGNVVLYFDSKLLFNRKFFIANFYTSSPNILEEKKLKNGDILYSRKYKKNYPNIKVNFRNHTPY